MAFLALMGQKFLSVDYTPKEMRAFLMAWVLQNGIGFDAYPYLWRLERASKRFFVPWFGFLNPYRTVPTGQNGELPKKII